MARGRPVKTNSKFVAEVKALVGDEYRFLEEYKGNKTEIKVRHNVCGEDFRTKPDDFLRGRKCPICALRVKKDKFREVVETSTSGEYLLLEDYKGSNTKVAVIHTQCGTTYKVEPYQFNRGRRCPHCNPKKLKTHEEFKEEVERIFGTEYCLKSEYRNSIEYIVVLHTDCEKEFQVTPNNFLSGSGCPNCKKSKGERAIADWLDNKGIFYEREIPIKYSKKERHLRIDFKVRGVAIEYDGIQHFEPVEAWGGEHKLRETQRRDRIKNEYCAANGIPMIRIPYWDFDRIDEILTDKLLPIIRNKDDKLA